MITVAILFCSWMNDALWCGKEPKEFSFSSQSGISLISQEYRLVEDLGFNTLVKAVMAPWPNPNEGCKLTVNGGQTVYYRYSCKKLRKELRGTCR